MEDEEKLVDAVMAGIQAAEMTPKQIRIFGNAVTRALGVEPPTTKEIEDYVRSSMEND